MTKFEDQLFADLMREYGPMLQSMQRPAATRRRPPSRSRPRWRHAGKGYLVRDVPAAPARRR
jgi:hypothetical protein